jgi:hypothetical protein
MVLNGPSVSPDKVSNGPNLLLGNLADGLEWAQRLS